MINTEDKLKSTSQLQSANSVWLDQGCYNISVVFLAVSFSIHCTSLYQWCFDYLPIVYFHLSVVFWLSATYLCQCCLDCLPTLYLSATVAFWLSAHSIPSDISGILTVCPKRISVCQWCLTIGHSVPPYISVFDYRHSVCLHMSSSSFQFFSWTTEGLTQAWVKPQFWQLGSDRQVNVSLSQQFWTN